MSNVLYNRLGESNKTEVANKKKRDWQTYGTQFGY